MERLFKRRGHQIKYFDQVAVCESTARNAAWTLSYNIVVIIANRGNTEVRCCKLPSTRPTCLARRLIAVNGVQIGRPCKM